MNASKVPLLAAIAVIVLFFVGGAFVGAPLPVEKSPADTVAWLQVHRDGIPVAVVCTTLALVPFLILTAWVRRALPDVYGYAFLAAAGAFGAQTMVSLWFVSGPALHADTIEPKTARALMDVGAYYGPILTSTDVVMAGAVALAALGAGALPNWLGWVSAVFAAEQVAEMSTIYGTSGFAAPGGPWNFGVGAALLMIWFLALGVALSRKPA